MKITFSNLGTIKKTTLDLRPLTVIIGPNNSNKTYIAYSIYGLWKIMEEFSPFNSEMSPFVKFFAKNGETEFSISLNNEEFINTLIEFLDNYIDRRLSIFMRQINEYFQDTSLKIFSDTDFVLDMTKEDLLETIKNLKITEFEGSISSSMHSRVFNTLQIKNDKIFFRSQGDESITENLTFSYSLLLGNFIGEIIRSLFKHPFLLPAERNAFIISYKILARNRLDILRSIQRYKFRERYEKELERLKEQGITNYPQPIEDFLDFLIDIELIKKVDFDSPESINFQQIANKIEEDIQSKNKTTFKSTRLGGKEIKINVKRGLNIDLYNASSSIKQLAPLLLYLRYRAQENDLLIIDEPEMNLHPESQAKLLEVLGMLVNAGVNVLLTTHSPYFMSHLNNLVSGKTGDEKALKEQAKSLYLKDERAFLSMDDVSAYEMKNNKLVSLKDKDYGIRWDTLSDVSADIQQKFFEIYEKGEEPTDGEEK
jgi:predicted ATPase